MRFFRAIFDFYLNASVHVAIAVVALVRISQLELDLEVPLELYGFVFFGTISGYNFVKYAGVARFHHRSLTKTLRAIQIFSLMAFIALCYFTFQVSFQTLKTASWLGLITFFYAVPLMNNRNLRSISGFKILVVGLVWAGSTVLLPAIEAGYGLDRMFWITFLQRIMIVVVLTIPFEIRDLPYDHSALGTMPQLLGLKGAKILGTVLLLGCIVMEYLKSGSGTGLIVFVVIALFTGVLLWLSHKKRSRYFSSFWVESIPILWYIAIVVLVY